MELNIVPKKIWTVQVNASTAVRFTTRGEARAFRAHSRANGFTPTLYVQNVTLSDAVVA